MAVMHPLDDPVADRLGDRVDAARAAYVAADAAYMQARTSCTTDDLEVERLGRVAHEMCVAEAYATYNYRMHIG